MNELLVIVGAIFLICVIVGVVRGFIKIVASLLATIAIIVLVVVLNPFVSGAIQKVVPLEELMQEKCMEILMPEAETDEMAEEMELSREAQIAAIEQSKLPEFFKQLLLENNNSEVYTILGVTTFAEYMVKYLAKIIADILAFLLTFLVVTIIVRTVLYIFGVIGDLPVIGGINRIAGGLLGLGTGVVIVWVLFIVITVMYDTALGSWGLEKIADNQILTILYENNILMEYVTKFRL